MDEIKKPKKILVVRYYQSMTSDGITNLICVGKPFNADNKHLKKFITPYEKMAAWAESKIRLSDYEFDNEPVSGYQFVYPTYATDKSDFYIMHPNGFRMPITVLQYRDLINSCTVINGKIQDELFFDNNLQLINPNTNIYKKMVKKQEREEIKKEISAELVAGCTIIHNKDSRKLLYCGKIHFLSNSSLAHLHLKKSSVLHHVFYDEVDSRYIAALTVTSGNYSVSTSTIKTIDLDEVVDKCNEQINKDIKFSDYKFFSNSVEPILVSRKKINSDKDLKIEYTAKPKSFFITTQTGLTLKEYISIKKGTSYICEKGGVTYCVLGFEGTEPSWRYTSRSVSENHTYNDKENYGVWGYPVTLSENGVIKWDIDVSKHRSLSWNSLFTNSQTHKTLIPMTFLGYVQNVEIKVGTPKEIK